MYAKIIISSLVLFFGNAAADTTNGIDNEVAEVVGFPLSRTPSKIAEWPKQPTVVVCKGAPTSADAVGSAVSWWRSLGYRFWTVIPDSIHYGCLMGEPEGNILIRLIDNRDVNPNNLATTYVYYNKVSGEILWAEILLREEPRERVLEHELGHALGWLHYSRRNHIMHPEWIKTGWQTTGLRNY